MYLRGRKGSSGEAGELLGRGCTSEEGGILLGNEGEEGVLLV